MLRRYRTAVLRQARRLGLNLAEADDASQLAFIVASGRLRDIAPGSERAFLLATVVRIARHHHGTPTARYEVLTERPEAMQDGPSADELLELKQTCATLERALQSLPAKMREVLLLHELEGFTLAEISARLDTPPGTVASRLRRGRDQLSAVATALHRAALAN